MLFHFYHDKELSEWLVVTLFHHPIHCHRECHAQLLLLSLAVRVCVEGKATAAPSIQSFCWLVGWLAGQVLHALPPPLFIVFSGMCILNKRGGNATEQQKQDIPIIYMKQGV